MHRLSSQPTGLASALLFSVLVLIGLMTQSTIFGAPLLETAAFWVASLLYGFIPGALLYLWLRPLEDNWMMLTGMGWVCGMLLQALLLLPLSMLGISHWFVGLPILLPFFLVAVYLKRGKVSQLTGPPLLHTAGLLLIIGLATVSSLYFSPRVLFQEARVVHHDIVFHAGNIADITYNWPLSDPRIAGEPQNYHFFSYFVPISVALPTQLPLTHILMRHLPGFGAMVLGIQLFNAGWYFSKKAYGGLLVALMILFHADVGWAITRVFRLERSLQTGSTLAESGYGSMSTLFGSLFLASLLLAALRWLQSEERDWANAFLIMALAAISAGTKSSLTPAILAGLGAVVVWRWFSNRTAPRSTLSLLLLTLPISLIVLFAVVAGEGGFTSYLTIKPGAAFVRTLLFETLVGGEASLLQAIAALPIWLIGYLGLGLIGTVVYTITQWQHLSDFALWAIFSLLAGLVVALSFDFYADERFFIDGPQIMLALLTAAVVAQLPAMKRAHRTIASALLVVFTIPILLYVVQRMRSGLSNSAYTARVLVQPIDDSVDAYMDGLDWMRRNLPDDAILMTEHGEIFLSAFAERQTYYETYRVGPLNNALAQQGFTGEYYPVKAAIRSAFFDESQDLLSAIEQVSVEFGGPVYVVVDNVEVGFNNGYSWKVHPLQDTLEERNQQYMEEIYSNESVVVYELLIN